MPEFTTGMPGPEAVAKLEALWARVTEQLSGTSTSSLTVGTGAKSLVTQVSKQFAIGQSVRVTRTSNVAVWMQGIVTAYNAATGALDVSVDTISGAGTFTDWTVALTGGSGPAGAAATIAVGMVTTGAAGSSAAVANSGSSAAAVFDFTIPRGDTGLMGPPNTLAIGTVTNGGAAAATITGAAPSQTLNLTLPQGPPGDAATIAVGTVTTGAAGSSVIVNNSGTSGAAVFDFTIPRGDPGLGSGDVVGPAASVASEVALFDGATGKLLKRSTGNGIMTLVGGVLALIANSTDNITEGAGNLYFTEARTRAAVATGLADTAGTPAATDSILTILGKVRQALFTDIAATIRATVLTGLSTATSTAIAAADSILVALGKAQAQLDLKAQLASPALTGTPTAPTAAAGTNTTQVATTAHVLAERTNTATLTNKRVAARVGTVASSATPTINTDNVDVFRITAQTVDITSMTTNLTGTPVDSDVLVIEITGTAARNITWGASFEASTVALPTTTVGTAKLTVGFLYNSVTSKWRCMAAV